MNVQQCMTAISFRSMTTLSLLQLGPIHLKRLEHLHVFRGRARLALVDDRRIPTRQNAYGALQLLSISIIDQIDRGDMHSRASRHTVHRLKRQFHFGRL